MHPTAHPLTWPAMRPRSPSPRPSKFDRQRTFAVARNELVGQLRKLGATRVTLSTNVELKSDGTPYSGRRQPDDRGVAVYFDLKQQRIVLACDRWNRAECNVFAIAMHIDAMRGQERWGVGDLAQAFVGYALPPPSTTKWRDVLGIHDFVVDAALIERRFVHLAKIHHPDVAGGSHEAMTALNVARDEALREIAGKAA